MMYLEVTTGNAYTGLHLNQGYTSGPANQTDISKLIVANGNISNAETLLVETWMQDAVNAKNRLKPFLQFSFDGVLASATAEYLKVFQADTYKGPWELIGVSYRPSNSPWSQSNHSVRDTKVFQWAGNNWIVYTWGGLAFGPFPQTQTFGLAKCISWPLEWYAQTDVDCSDVIPNNANSRCFIADAGVIDGIKVYTIVNVHGSSADPFQFNCYIKTSTDATLATWGATTILTGSTLPAKVSSGKLRQENGIFYFICKDVSADPAGSHYILKSDGNEVGPYNSSRTLTELDDTGGSRTGFEYVMTSSRVEVARWS